MKKTITFELSPISVEVEVKDGLTKEEILELGKKQVIESLSKKFPFYKYGIVDGNVMKDEDIHPGLPVRIKDSGELAIISAFKRGQKFPIKLTTESGKSLSCVNSAVEKISKRTNINKLIKGRLSWERDINEWFAGKAAFFVNGKDIIPVILDTSGRNKFKAYIVSHEAKGSYYNLTSSQFHLLFDTFQEAEGYTAGK